MSQPKSSLPANLIRRANEYARELCRSEIEQIQAVGGPYEKVTNSIASLVDRKATTLLDDAKSMTVAQADRWIDKCSAIVAGRAFFESVKEFLQNKENAATMASKPSSIAPELNELLETLTAAATKYAEEVVEDRRLSESPQEVAQFLVDEVKAASRREAMDFVESYVNNGLHPDLETPAWQQYAQAVGSYVIARDQASRVPAAQAVRISEEGNSDRQNER